MPCSPRGCSAYCGMTRRDFAQRLALGFGVALTPGTVAAILSGCRPAETAAYGFLSVPEGALVDSLCEGILPATDTPGARAASAVRYVDMLLSDFSDDDERAAVRAQLAGLAAWLEPHGAATLDDLDADTRDAVLRTLDQQAFPDSDTEVVPMIADLPGGDPPLFQRLKPWTVAGFYTSEVGATQELHVNPMGSYQGDLPLADVGRTWA